LLLLTRIAGIGIVAYSIASLLLLLHLIFHRGGRDGRCCLLSWRKLLTILHHVCLMGNLLCITLARGNDSLWGEWKPSSGELGYVAMRRELIYISIDVHSIGHGRDHSRS
jgi:hypothetical protein